jgi:hypothetical protein
MHLFVIVTFDTLLLQHDGEYVNGSSLERECSEYGFNGQDV